MYLLINKQLITILAVPMHYHLFLRSTRLLHFIPYFRIILRLNKPVFPLFRLNRFTHYWLIYSLQIHYFYFITKLLLPFNYFSFTKLLPLIKSFNYQYNFFYKIFICIDIKFASCYSVNLK